MEPFPCGRMLVICETQRRLFNIFTTIRPKDGMFQFGLLSPTSGTFAKCTYNIIGIHIFVKQKIPRLIRGILF